MHRRESFLVFHSLQTSNKLRWSFRFIARPRRRRDAPIIKAKPYNLPLLGHLFEAKGVNTVNRFTGESIHRNTQAVKGRERP